VFYRSDAIPDLKPTASNHKHRTATNEGSIQKLRPGHVNDSWLLEQYWPCWQLCLPVMHSSMSVRSYRFNY